MKWPIVFLSLAAFAAEPLQEMGTASMSLANGLRCTVTARTTREKTGVTSFGVRGSGTGEFFFREFEGKQGVVFAYEFHATRLDTSDGIRVVLRPVGERYTQLTGRRDVPTLAAERELPLLRLGDKALVDILENPTTGARIVDVIQVDTRPTVPGVNPDAPGIHFSRTVVTINGTEAARSTGGIWNDAITMFWIPGRGSYFFSRTPVKGYNFRQIGVVDGQRLTCSWDNDHIEVVSAVPISEVGQLWVYFDPRKPASRWAGKNEKGFFQAGASTMSSFYPSR